MLGIITRIPKKPPSGTPQPSQEDRLITRKLVLASDALSIKILDHIVLGDGSESYFSFADEQLL